MASLAHIWQVILILLYSVPPARLTATDPRSGLQPNRWKKIYALSRRPPSGSWPNTVQHIPLDFLQSPKQIAEVLREQGIKPDYVFFFSYVLVHR